MSWRYTLSFILLFFVSLFIFLPSFKLALFGDDWLTLWRYILYLEPSSFGEWNHLNYFFTSYGPQDILMGLLQKVFRYESVYYYLVSYILRLLASFSFIPLLWYFTKNRLATFISVSFFLITTTGIETTNWVFNMPSYLAIIFLNLFFYYFFVSRFDKHKLFVAIFFFFLATTSQPIRMHGLFPEVFLLELFWIIQSKKKSVSKKATLRIIIFLLVTIFIAIFGLMKSPVATISNLVTHNSLFSIKYLLNPVITLGSLILPSDILPLGINFILFIIGGLFVIFSVILLCRFYTNYLYSTALFLSFSWAIVSFILAWWREPSSIFFTTHRYLIVSAVGISIFVGILSNLKKTKLNKIVLYLFILICLILHIYSTRAYLSKAEKSHGQNISNKIWSSIPYVADIGKTNTPLVFYFIGDGTNDLILHDVITFGFPPHLGLIYNIFDESKTPIPMSDPKEVISAVTNGASFSSYGHKQKAISPQRIYAFQLRGEDTLINITNSVRQKLEELKDEY